MKKKTLFLLAALSTSAALATPNYEITKDEQQRNIKRSIEVVLSERATKQELKEIAESLHETGFKNTFIGYRISGENQGSYWATTHFTPTLDVKIIGSTVEQKNLDIDHVDKPESIESDEDYEKRMEAVRAEAKAKYDAIVAKNIEESEKSKNQKPSKSTINSTNPNQPYSRGTGRSFIRESLKDSGSAKFRNDFISSSSAYCGELNAKNSFGAYVGFQRFIVINGVAAFETARNTNDFSNLWNSDCKK